MRKIDVAKKLKLSNFIFANKVAGKWMHSMFFHVSFTRSAIMTGFAMSRWKVIADAVLRGYGLYCWIYWIY